MGSKKMERFFATVKIEELKPKAKNANTTKSTYQWLRAYLSYLAQNFEAKNRKLQG